MTSAINESELPGTALTGAVTSPSMTMNPYEIAASGTPFVPVGSGGVCYNVKVGMSALDWAADQVEPGVSMANPDGPSNEALSLYACVGNRVVVRSGAAAGAEGVVTGKHEAFMGYKHVLVHVADDVLEQVAPGDALVVRAHGRGMRVPEVPAVACHSLSPQLWNAWAPQVTGGRLAVRVTRVLPPEVVGSGSGRVSAVTSVALQRGVPDGEREDALEGLRLGDLIAVRDWDATYYTGYRQGALTVGVVVCGDSPVAGNGPGITLLVTAPDGAIEPEIDGSANLRASSDYAEDVSAAAPLLETRRLSKHFDVSSGLFSRLGRKAPEVLVAVDDVSLSIRRGETMGLVGESGSGKSTFGRLILQLYEPTAGEILFEGQSVLHRGAAQTRALRRRIQVIFQDPYASLNPTMSVRQMLGEALSVHEIVDKQARNDRIVDLLERVGLAPELADRRPHQFSGGQRQRVCIARALAVEPEFIVADEAVSALDVSVQAQVLNLMMKLQEDLGLTYLFISHNLTVMRHISQHVAVMYLGRIVEQSPTETLFAEPLHPYTQALLKAAPKPVPKRRAITPAVTGDIPSPIDRPAGCHFHPRCPAVMPICREIAPRLQATPSGAVVACHLYGEPAADEAQPG